MTGQVLGGRSLTDLWPHLSHARRRIVLRDLQWEAIRVRREVAAARAARDLPVRLDGSVRVMAQRLLDRMPPESPHLVRERRRALANMPSVPQAFLKEKGRWVC
jgi:hypothetical protein